MTENGSRVAWIAIAPVKSLALTHPDEVELGPLGVRENRRFYLVDEDGRLLNGKRLGRLALTIADYDDTARTLALRLPSGDVVAGEVAHSDTVTTQFFSRLRRDRLVEGPWSEALSQSLGRPVRLVEADESTAVDRGGDDAAATLLSTASLAELGRRAGADEPVDPRRFRMLFGVDGLDPHEEDGWRGRDVRVGDALVRVRGNVGRCVVTTQNPATGVPDLDTLRVLADYRGELETTEPLPFGVYADVREPGRVRLGDPVGVER